jgi:hypothetical protein
MNEMRRGTRHDVDYSVTAEHRKLGDISLHIANISDQGFMILGHVPLARGERIAIRLPIIGRIEAHLVWAHEGRAGFQIERVIRPDELRNFLLHVRNKPQDRKHR